MIFIQNMFRSSALRQVNTTIGLYPLKAENVAKYVVNDILNCLHLEIFQCST